MVLRKPYEKLKIISFYNIYKVYSKNETFLKWFKILKVCLISLNYSKEIIKLRLKKLILRFEKYKHAFCLSKSKLTIIFYNNRKIKTYNEYIKLVKIL